MTTATTEQHLPPATIDNSPIALIDRAQALNADPAQVEKWMELAERYERREAEKAYAQAMHACQQEMPNVYKNTENTHTRSRYVTHENLDKKIHPIYSEHGFSLSFGEDACPTDGYKRTVCDVTHIAGHMRRYYLDLPIDGEGSQGGKSAMNRVQGCISTTSYGQRRLKCMIFNITLTDEDDDGQGANIKRVSEEQAIQLQEASQGVKDSLIRAGFKWVGKMTGVTPTKFSEVPAIAFRDFRAKLIEHADEARKG